MINSAAVFYPSNHRFASTALDLAHQVNRVLMAKDKSEDNDFSDDSEATDDVEGRSFEEEPFHDPFLRD